MADIASLGAVLRRARQAHGLSLEDISRKTRISAHLLQALEDENLSAFPAEVYARGFLRSYARCLKIDEREVAALYDALRPPARSAVSVTPAVLARQQPAGGSVIEKAAASNIPFAPKSVMPSAPWRTARRNRRMLFWLGFSGVLVLAIISLMFGVRGLRDWLGPGDAASQETQVASHTLEANTTESVWVRIEADGQVLFEGVLPPQANRSWPARSQFRIKVGYIPGIRLVFDGKPVEMQPFGGGNVSKEMVLPAADAQEQRPAPVTAPPQANQ